MMIKPELDDAPEFVGIVEHVIEGMIARHKPEHLVVMKIDNWFGSNWLGFSGKALGLVGVWDKPYDRPAVGLRIPPFVPNRVVSQRRFSAPDYIEIDPGTPIHVDTESTHALLRKARFIEPHSTLVWYSGDSKSSGRGALMVYASVKESYWPWYASWQREGDWRLVDSWDIKRDELERMGRAPSERLDGTKTTL